MGEPEVSSICHLKRLIAWLTTALERNDLSIPVIAGLVHYQCATIHPYYDGNGRTARLLTTFILHHAGYGLHGIYSLEEYYAEHLQGYYDALAVGTNHNYYEGRAEAEVTPFLAYFCIGMADSFAKIRSQAEKAQGQGQPDHTAPLRELTSQKQKVLSLFRVMKTVTSSDVAHFLTITQRAASALCSKWLGENFLIMTDPSKKAQRYQLAEMYEALIQAIRNVDALRVRTPHPLSSPPHQTKSGKPAPSPAA